MEKYCSQCGKLFKKKSTTSLKDWQNRVRFCSKECHNLSKIGQSSWNKGIKGAQIAWNKGKKLHYNVWNKGKILELSDELKVKKAKIIRQNVANYWATATEKQKKERSKKISEGLKNNPYIRTTALEIGVKSKLWKGEQANYNSKHKWIQNHWEKTDVCEDCGLKVLPNPKTRLKHATQWANISRQYKRDRNDWKELCVKCHYNFDKNL